MEDYIINVQEIEELQMINNVAALDHIFRQAKKTITGGMSILLVRGGLSNKFDELTTEGELKLFKESVYKYIRH